MGAVRGTNMDINERVARLEKYEEEHAKSYSQNYHWSFDYVTWRSASLITRIISAHHIGGGRTIQ
jgi:predicted transcriptional regulator